MAANTETRSTTLRSRISEHPQPALLWAGVAASLLPPAARLVSGSDESGAGR